MVINRLSYCLVGKIIEGNMILEIGPIQCNAHSRNDAFFFLDFCPKAIQLCMGEKSHEGSGVRKGHGAEICGQISISHVYGSGDSNAPPLQRYLPTKYMRSSSGGAVIHRHTV